MSSADSFSISSKRSSAAFSLTRLSVPLCSGTVGGGGGFETPGLEFGVRAFVSSWDLEGRAKSRAKIEAFFLLLVDSAEAECDLLLELRGGAVLLSTSFLVLLTGKNRISKFIELLM